MSDLARPLNSTLAFGHLTPDGVLDALESVGLRGDGRILQLNSYENRVFQVMLEDGRAVVAKFYRPGRWSDAQILQEHDFCLELAAAEVPVMAPLPLELSLERARPGQSSRLEGAQQTLLHWSDGTHAHRVSVSAYLGGRDPHVESDADWVRLGRLMGRVHAVGRKRRFEHRLKLQGSLAQAAIDTLLALDVVDLSLRSRWEAVARDAASAVARAFEQGPQLQTIRLHGDAHRGNLLERDGALHLVDLDDAAQGPAVQDLWLFLDGQDSRSAQHQLHLLLSGYEEFMDFDDGERRLIEPLRTLRVLRHSAWIAQRWEDPAFAQAFPSFGSPSHWADQLTQLQEQMERMGA